MVEKKTSDAQLRANEKWKEKNKEKQRRYILKSNAKNFIYSATKEEVLEIDEWLSLRKKELENF